MPAEGLIADFRLRAWGLTLGDAKVNSRLRHRVGMSLGGNVGCMNLKGAVEPVAMGGWPFRSASVYRFELRIESSAEGNRLNLP